VIVDLQVKGIVEAPNGGLREVAQPIGQGQRFQRPTDVFRLDRPVGQVRK